MVGPASDWATRWRERRQRWRHRSDGVFDPTDYHVEALDEDVARDFVVTHHYSHDFPSTRLRYGLFERERLVGTAVFSVPIREAVLTGPFPQLVPYRESLDLGRFVLLDEVAYNGESWFLARVFALARRAGLRGVVAFSDPVERRTASGLLVCPGHLGIIYQSSNAVYLGKTKPSLPWIFPDGTTLHPRATAKLKAGHQGRNGVVARLIARGAQPPYPGEDPKRWLEAALRTTAARPFPHSGHYKYAFALGSSREKRALTRDLERKRYPKWADLGRTG